MAESDTQSRDLEQHAAALGERIAVLQRRLRSVKSTARREQLDRFATLEQRHRELGGHIKDIGTRPEAKGMAEKLADDLDGDIKNFVDWVDAGERPGAPPPGSFSP